MTTHDSTGFRIFSEGDLGAAHSMAHQMLDLGAYEVGHDRLAAWLDGRIGTGSKWIHLQWHMLVFELAVQRRDSALERFRRYVLPAATTGDALTDAPAGLWRLRLAHGDALELPWSEVRDTAVAHLDDDSDPYVTLHNLLALAGAGDLATLDRWLAAHEARSPEQHTLERMALGLRCFASRDYDLSAAALDAGLPGVAALGGSRAQNELFSDIRSAALSRCINHNQKEEEENNGNHYC